MLGTKMVVLSGMNVIVDSMDNLKLCPGRQALDNVGPHGVLFGTTAAPKAAMSNDGRYKNPHILD